MHAAKGEQLRVSGMEETNGQSGGQTRKPQARWAGEQSHLVAAMLCGMLHYGF
jgi:hypothetical protein